MLGLLIIVRFNVVENPQEKITRYYLHYNMVNNCYFTYASFSLSKVMRQKKLNCTVYRETGKFIFLCTEHLTQKLYKIVAVGA